MTPTVLKSFCISFNDALDDTTRQRLRPYLGRCIGTADDGLDEQRAWMAADWLLREYVPAFLDVAKLHDQACNMRSLAAVIDVPSLKAAQPVLNSARRDAAAAWDAAWDAAGAALAPTVVRLQDSAFDLLDRMLPRELVELPAPQAERLAEVVSG